jgi:hypothetical protein
MSFGLPLKADSAQYSQHVSNVPKPEISPKAKPLDARAVRFSEPRRGYALSLGSALATSRAYLANNSVTS